MIYGPLLWIILGAFVLIAWAMTLRQNTDRIVDTLEAIEVRRIQREKDAGLDANKAARWQG